VDARTNGLIVRADSKATIDKVRKLVEQLDVPTSATGNIHVVYLRNAEATKVAEALRGILGGGSQTGGAGGGAQPAPPPQPAAQPGQPGQPTAGGAPAPIVNIPQAQGGGSIQAYPATNSLVITAPDYVYNGLRSVIEKLDARRAQVFVEALIVELSANKAAEFGVQWQNFTGFTGNTASAVGGTNFNAGGAGTNIVGVATNPASVGPGLNIGIVRGQISLGGQTFFNLGLLARALQSDSDTNILSTPNLLTLDNEEAKIIDGQNVPFITGTQPTSTVAGGIATPFTTVDRKDIGLQLKVKPSVAEGGAVKLTIFQEVSSIADQTNAAGIITNKRSIESTVIVDDGQTVVLGGLIKDNVTNGVDKVPVLGNIPLLGNLFRYDKRSHVKTNLMIFIRPSVMRNTESSVGVTNERYDYIRNEQTRMQPEHHWILPDMRGPELPKPEARPEPQPGSRAEPQQEPPARTAPRAPVPPAAPNDGNQWSPAPQLEPGAAATPPATSGPSARLPNEWDQPMKPQQRLR
jgi:general secretion pathway protein D